MQTQLFIGRSLGYVTQYHQWHVWPKPDDVCSLSNCKCHDREQCVKMHAMLCFQCTDVHSSKNCPRSDKTLNARFVSIKRRIFFDDIDFGVLFAMVVMFNHGTGMSLLMKLQVVDFERVLRVVVDST